MVNLTVITGPPCAGKTTYARQHALPGDITVDFDAIAQALGSPASHGHDSHLAEVAAAAWSAAIREALNRPGRHRTWIIDSKPSPWRRGEYDRAGARYVRLTAAPARTPPAGRRRRTPARMARKDRSVHRRPRPATTHSDEMVSIASA